MRQAVLPGVAGRSTNAAAAAAAAANITTTQLQQKRFIRSQQTGPTLAGSDSGLQPEAEAMSTESLGSGQSGRSSRRRFFQSRLFQRLRRHSSPGGNTADLVLLQAYQSTVEFNLKNELYICKRKLVSKCEALGVLCRELDKLKEEREEFKALAQQAHARCQIMRRALGFGELLEEQMKPMVADGDDAVLHQLLFECIEHNKALQAANAELRESLENLQGDMRLLRERVRDSAGCVCRPPQQQQQQQHQAMLDPSWVQERCQMAQQLEQGRIKLDQLQADLRTLLDEKEELVVERDALRGKYDRVNCELNYILKGDAGRILDIDAVVMENKYLQERLNQMEEERAMAYQAVSKYKSMLERHKSAVYEACLPQQSVASASGHHHAAVSAPTTTTMTSSNASPAGAVGSRSSTGNAQPVITQKTVKSLVSTLTPSATTLRDLQSLARALLDTIQDRNLALTHQRKANRLLAERVADLERQVGSMECSGYWRNACSVFKTRSMDDVRNLFPERVREDSAGDVGGGGSGGSGGGGGGGGGGVGSADKFCDGLDRWPCRDPEGQQAA